MSREETIRVLIADDHPVVRAGLKAMLAAQPHVVVVGEAATAAEASALASRLEPDVTLLDLRLPDLSGVAAVAALRDAHPAGRVLVVSSLNRPGDVRSAIEAGAAGYVVKDAVDVELLRAVRAVARGGLHVTGTAADRLAESRELERLTTREHDILALMADGLNNQEIAGLLNISVGTVKNYVHTILLKLRVRDRTAAVTAALRSGLLPPA